MRKVLRLDDAPHALIQPNEAKRHAGVSALKGSR
jgi:hypothetical protein